MILNISCMERAFVEPTVAHHDLSLITLYLEQHFAIARNHLFQCNEPGKFKRPSFTGQLVFRHLYHQKINTVYKRNIKGEKYLTRNEECRTPYHKVTHR